VTANWVARKAVRLAGLAALLAGLCVPAAAATTACVALSGTPPVGTPVGDFIPPPTPTFEGCHTTDYRFINFNVGAATGSIDGLPIPAATFSPPDTQIYIATGVIDPQGFILTAPGSGGGGSKPEQNYCGPNSADQGWCISGTAGTNRTLVSTTSFTIESLLGPTIQYIGYTGTIWSHSSAQGGSTALVFREYCAGVASPAGLTWGDGNNCAAMGGVYGVMRAGQIVGGFDELPFFIVDALPSAYSVVQIRDTVLLSTGTSGGSWAALTPLEFIDTPEPSTFGLMSLAIGGLAVLRARRRRKARAGTA
jgi:hypothetical protein